MRFTFDLAKARRNERNKLPGDVLKTYTRQGKSYSYYGPPDDSTPDWRERLLHEEEGIRHLALEHIVVRLSDDSWHFTGPEYTADFFRTHGEVKGRSSANTAALPEALLEQMRADGHAVLTHNHPKSAPPSVEDIGTAMDANLAEIRACTDGGVWVVRRPAAGWPDARSFLTTWLSRFEGPTNRNALARTQFLLSTGVLSDANEEAKAFAENVFSTIYGEECARALGGILSRMGASLEYVPASGRASSSGQPPTGPVSGEQVDDLFRRAAEKAQSLGPAGHEMMLEMVRQLRDLSKARAKRPRGVPYEHNGGWWVIGEDGKRRRAKPPAAQAETQRLTEPTTYRGTLQHLATDPDEHEAETNVHQTTLQQLHHGAKLHGRIAAAASAEADRAVRAKDRAYWSEAHVRHKLAEHHFLVARNMSQANHARTTEHIQGAFEAERHAHELGAAKRLQGRTGVAGHLRRAGVLRDLRNGRHFIFHWSPEMSATPLNKASPGALRIPVMAKAAQTWNVDGLTCRFFQNPGGVNYVTIEVPALATTWTEIVRDDGQAREYARRFAPVLAKGGTPAMGVFQRMQVLDMAKAVRPPQRRASGTAPRFTFDMEKAKRRERGVPYQEGGKWWVIDEGAKRRRPYTPPGEGGAASEGKAKGRGRARSTESTPAAHHEHVAALRATSDDALPEAVKAFGKRADLPKEVHLAVARALVPDGTVGFHKPREPRTKAEAKQVLKEWARKRARAAREREFERTRREAAAEREKRHQAVLDAAVDPSVEPPDGHHRIALKDAPGKATHVETEARAGLYAVHKLEGGAGYHVTHLPTGSTVASRDTKADAIKAMKHFAHHAPQAGAHARWGARTEEEFGEGWEQIRNAHWNLRQYGPDPKARVTYTHKAARFTFDLAKAKGKRYWDGDGEPPAGQGWQRGKRGGWWKPTGAGHTEAPARAARAPGAEPRKRRRATADVGARMADVAEEPAAAPTPAPSIAPGHRWNPHELSDLWHLSRTAVGRTAGTYARKQWVADQYAKQHGLSPTAVYKKMERYGIGEGLTISQEQHVARDRDGNGWQRVSGGGWRHRDDAAAAPMTHEQRRDHLIHAGATALVEAIGKLRAQGWHGKLSDVLPGAKARTIEPLPGEFAIAVTGGPFDYPEPVNGASGWRFVGPRVRGQNARAKAWEALEEYAQAVAAQPAGTSWREFARMAHDMEDGDPLRKAVGGFRVVLAGGYEQAVGVPLFTFDMAKARSKYEYSDTGGPGWERAPKSKKGKFRRLAGAADGSATLPRGHHHTFEGKSTTPSVVRTLERAGIYAVHKDKSHTGEFPYTVTHLPSGRTLPHGWRTREYAADAVKHLAHHAGDVGKDVALGATGQDFPDGDLARLERAHRRLVDDGPDLPEEAPTPKPEAPKPEAPSTPRQEPAGRLAMRRRPAPTASREDHDKHDTEMVRYHSAMATWHRQQAGPDAHYQSPGHHAHISAALRHASAADSYRVRLSEKKPTVSDRNRAAKESEKAEQISKLALEAHDHARHASALEDKAHKEARTLRQGHAASEVNELRRQAALHGAAARQKREAVDAVARSSGRGIDRSVMEAINASSRAGGVDHHTPMPDAETLAPHMMDVRHIASPRHPAQGGGTGTWSGNAKHLKQAVRHVKSAVGAAGRRDLDGIHTEVLPNGHLRIVATDGHRMHIADIPGEGTEGSIHPGHLTDADTLTALAQPGGKLQLNGRSKVATTPGEFPDYQAIMPDFDGQNTVEFDKAALTEALAAHQRHLKKRASPVAFIPTGSGHRLVSHSDGEKLENHVASTKSGSLEGDAFGFNPAYLLDAIKHTPGKTVRVSMGHRLSPAGVSGHDGSGHDRKAVNVRSVVMPMRLDDMHKGARFVFVLAKAKKRAKASESDLMTAMVGPAHFRDTPKPSPDIDHYGHAHEDRVASMRAQTKAATLKGTDKIRTEALGYALHAKSMAHTHHGHALAWGGDSERHAHGKAAVMQEASHAAWKRVADGDTSPEAIWHASRTAHEAMQHSLIAEEPAPSQVQAAGKRMTERAAALAEQKATAAAGKAPRARKPRAGGAAPAPTPATPQEPAAATAAPKARKSRAPKAAGIPAPPPAPELPMGDAPAKAPRKRAPKGAVPATKGRGWRFVFALAKAKKQPLGSLSHRKAGTFIKVREEGKPTDWVPAHEVGGRWEAKPEGAKRRGRKKAEAAPAPVPLPPERDETLVWYKDTAGVKAGAVHKNGAKWVVIVSAKPARSRRVSSHDEDMGWGQEGGRLTQQAVRLRDALPHEVAAEEQRRLDKKAAAEAATPGGRFDAWKAAHADAMPHPEHETPPGVKWTEVHRDGTQSFHVGEGPDGSQWAKLTTSSYDDRRTSYLRTPPDPAKAAAVAQQQDHARALLDRIAETGTYTSADLEHLTQDLAQELHNNRLEREAPGRLRLGPNQRPIETADATRAVTLQRVLAGHRVFAGVEGPHDLAFETAYRDPMSMAEHGTVESTLTEVIRKLRGAEPPPGYGPMVQERIALAEGKLATAKAEAEAEERAKAEAAAERAAARATRSSSRATSRSPSASFTKLRDGSWGVRVEGDADEGDTVTVRRKDGSKESKRLGRLVHDGGSYKLFKMTKAMRFVFDPQALGL